jgi:pimeloyl-ACP methyl ester carboxylesterase
MSAMKKVLLCIIPIIAAFSGCMSLDPFLFAGKPLDTYQMDSYPGERECASFIDQNPAFNDSFAHIFTIPSGSEHIAGIFLSRTAADTVLPSTDILILYFHGKSDHNDYYWPRTRMLWQAGYPVVAIDFRGFGMSTGTTSEATLYEDARATMKYIQDTLGNPRVIVYGFSLGSMPACELASNSSYNQIIKLILEAPIGKVETIVENGSYLDIPGSYLTTYSGNNAEKIKSVTVPLLWLHGTKDETLPRETHGLRIWNNYTDPAGKGRYIKIENAGHGTIPQTMSSDYTDYIDCIAKFIRDDFSSSWFHTK